MKATKNKLSAAQLAELLSTLKLRLKKNMPRHKGITWSEVELRIFSKGNDEKQWSLSEMERTGGEPDVVGMDKKTGEYIFYDCAPESPSGRRSFCYDAEALASRKENKPKDSAIHAAGSMGIEILAEEQYRELQQLGKFDTKTSSWISTPDYIRKLGGAIFADHRYGTIFIYHNGAESYYAGRGFRGMLRV